MSARALETLLARLYTNEDLRRAFLADPAGTARDAGLDSAQAQALENIDREGLVLAAHSFATKREAHAAKRERTGLAGRVRRWFGR